jgi:tryptophan synthase alpha chain
MNRIDKLFQEKKENILSIYFTAGFPELNNTATLIKELEQNGVDLIEIGMPFSDPMADGPIIQQSSQKALENGMSLKLLFEQLKDIRKEVKIPLILMGYLNPVFQFGLENFCKKCAETGIDGLILPDLPMKEYEEKYKSTFEKYNIFNIFLITPQTSEERIKQIDNQSKGFIYMVSSFSTTGAGKGIEGSQPYFERIKKMNLKNPTMIGFGISNSQAFKFACNYARGGIIGSSFVKEIENKGTKLNEIIRNFVQRIIT